MRKRSNERRVDGGREDRRMEGKRESQLPIRDLSRGIGIGYVYFISTVHTESADRFY